MKTYRQTAIRHNLKRRAAVIQALRRFFSDNHFLEVDTPLRTPAPAPERHIGLIASDTWCLQASPELCMKRLLAAGFSRLFQICKCFRAGERGRKHLPEFTLLEWYSTDIDYFGFMAQCEALIQSVAAALGNRRTLVYQGHAVALTSPWQRLTVSDAFHRFAGVSVEDALASNRFDEIMVTAIEPNLGYHAPVFLHDYPAECASLARLAPHDKTLAQRFELYICGLELCNGFMELTDPREQRHRFEKERQQIRRMDRPTYPMPEKFLSALEDMPAAAGNALGVDRLVMLFADTDRIDDVVAFTGEEM